LYVIAGEPEWDMNDVRAVTPAEIAADLLELPYAVSWVTPGVRQARCLEAEAAGFRSVLTLIDPAAVLASNADVASGVYINAGATIGAFVTLVSPA